MLQNEDGYGKRDSNLDCKLAPEEVSHEEEGADKDNASSEKHHWYNHKCPFLLLCHLKVCSIEYRSTTLFLEAFVLPFIFLAAEEDQEYWRQKANEQED